MTPVLFRMKAEKVIKDARKGTITKQKALNILNGFKNSFNTDHPYDSGNASHRAVLSVHIDEAIKLAERI